MKWSLNGRLALASLGIVAATTTASRSPAPREQAGILAGCNQNCYDPCGGGQCNYACQFNIVNAYCNPHQDPSFYYCDGGYCYTP